MEKQFYQCAICGNFFGVIQEGAGQPVCCGQAMTKLKANSTDAAGEKHVPVIDRDGHKVKVSVGSVTHPMGEDHYIEWIIVMQEDRVQRAVLKPGMEPVAEFTVACDKCQVKAYAYCNLHGLWTGDEAK